MNLVTPWVASLLLAGAPVVDPAPLELLVSGRSGGISAHLTRMLAPTVMTRPRPVGPALSILQVEFRALEHHGCYLIMQDGQSQDAALSVVADPTRTRRLVRPGRAAQSVLDLSFTEHPGDELVSQLLAHQADVAGQHPFDAAEVMHTRWDSGHGSLWGVETRGCSAQDAASTDVGVWELRSVTVMGHPDVPSSPRLWSVARPLGEGVRRHVAHARLKEEARAHGAATLDLLAGDDVEGASYLQRRASLHRPVTAAALQQRRPDAWAAQSSELHDGVDAFATLARSVGAAPLSANLRRSDGSQPLRGWQRFDVGEHTVVVIGLTGRGEGAELPPDVARQLRVTAPEPALQDALKDAVATLGRWPDLVVAMGTLDGADALAVQESPGVDVALVRFTKQDTLQSSDVTVDTSAGRAVRSAQLVPRLSPYRVEHTRIWFHPHAGPARLLHTGTPLTVDAPVDDVLTRQVQLIRQPIYQAGSRALLPDFTPLLRRPDAPPSVVALADRDASGAPRLGRALFGQLMASLLRKQLSADVAITPPPREFWKTGGPFTLLRMQAALAGEDELAAAVLSGPELKRLLGRAEGDGVGISGANADQVAGRAYDDKERYFLITTASLVVAYGLENRVVARRFGHVGNWWFPAPLWGSAVSYRQAIMDALTPLQQQDARTYDATMLRLLTPSHGTQRPRVVMEARDLTLSFTDYDVTGRERYPDVPDARVKTQRNVSIYAMGTLRVALESPWVVAEGRYNAKWDRRVFNRQDAKEAFNAWTASLELRAPWLGGKLPLLGWRLEPYVATSMESMFVPIPWGFEPVRNIQKPGQAWGRASAGAALLDNGILKELRVAGVIQQDLLRVETQLPRAFLAHGAASGVETSGLFTYDVGPISAELTHLWRWLLPRPGVDTPRDLALTAMTRAAVKARVFDGLSVTSFADLFVFQGRKATDRPGNSYTLGVGVAFDRRYKPLSEGAFLW